MVRRVRVEEQMIETDIAVIKSKLENIEGSISSVKAKLDKDFVTKAELELVKQRLKNIDWLIGSIVLAIFALVVNLISTWVTT